MGSTPDLAPLERLFSHEEWNNKRVAFNLCTVLLGHTPRYEFEYRMPRAEYPGLDADPVTPILDDLPLAYHCNIDILSHTNQIRVAYTVAPDSDSLHQSEKTLVAHRDHGRYFGYPEPDIDAYLDYQTHRDHIDKPYTHTYSIYLDYLATTEEYDIDTLALAELVQWLPALNRDGIDRAINEGEARYTDALTAAREQDLSQLAREIRAHYEIKRRRLERRLTAPTND